VQNAASFFGAAKYSVSTADRRCAIVSTARGSGWVILPRMSRWNDTDLPWAYLISFRAYGTWLHGDERGSTDRFHHQYRSPHIPPNVAWQFHNKRVLKCPPVRLDAARRASTENAIRETCTIRGWLLRAINVRTNHVHTVVSTGEANGRRVLNAFKANATRQMREDLCWPRADSPWADRSSKRSLWNQESIGRAIDYVLNGQGDELPGFD